MVELQTKEENLSFMCVAHKVSFVFLSTRGWRGSQGFDHDEAGSSTLLVIFQVQGDLPSWTQLDIRDQLLSKPVYQAKGSLHSFKTLL